jgi:hypothetical protein
MAYLSLLVPLLTLAVLPLADRLERWALSSDPAAAERPAIRRRRSRSQSLQRLQPSGPDLLDELGVVLLVPVGVALGEIGDRLRAPTAKPAANRFTSYSNGPGSVSSKSFTSNRSTRSGEANNPNFDRWASPQSWTVRPAVGVLARSAAMIFALDARV